MTLFLLVCVLPALCLWWGYWLGSHETWVITRIEKGQPLSLVEDE